MSEAKDVGHRMRIIFVLHGASLSLTVLELRGLEPPRVQFTYADSGFFGDPGTVRKGTGSRGPCDLSLRSLKLKFAGKPACSVYFGVEIFGEVPSTASGAYDVKTTQAGFF